MSTRLRSSTVISPNGTLTFSILGLKGLGKVEYFSFKKPPKMIASLYKLSSDGEKHVLVGQTPATKGFDAVFNKEFVLPKLNLESSFFVSVTEATKKKKPFSAGAWIPLQRYISPTRTNRKLHVPLQYHTQGPLFQKAERKVTPQSTVTVRLVYEPDIDVQGVRNKIKDLDPDDFQYKIITSDGTGAKLKTEMDAMQKATFWMSTTSDIVDIVSINTNVLPAGDVHCIVTFRARAGARAILEEENRILAELQENAAPKKKPTDAEEEAQEEEEEESLDGWDGSSDDADSETKERVAEGED